MSHYDKKREKTEELPKVFGLTPSKLSGYVSKSLLQPQGRVESVQSC